MHVTRVSHLVMSPYSACLRRLYDTHGPLAGRERTEHE